MEKGKSPLIGEEGEVDGVSEGFENKVAEAKELEDEERKD